MKNPKLSASKPVGTGNTRLKFDNSPTIAATDEGKKKNPALQTGMFGASALGSQMSADGEYAAKSKKGFYNESVFEHKDNEILPTENY